MLYTPSHAELAQHPKTRKLARRLGVSIPTAIGHLHLLWHFALKYAADGDLSRFEWEEIEDGVMWDGTADAFITDCIAIGWLDCNEPDDDAHFGVSIHGWEEYGGKAIRQKEDNAERQQRWRDRHKTVSKPSPNKPVTVTSPLPNALEEKRIDKKKEEEKIASSHDDDRANAPKQSAPIHAEHFAAFWDAYPKKVGKKACAEWWDRRKPDDELTQTILDGVETYKRSDTYLRGFIKDPIGWLKEERWTDEPDEPAPTQRGPLGRDKERVEVLERVLERRGYVRDSTGPIAYANGSEISHEPIRIGDRRLP
jgi:hypothetical protein